MADGREEATGAGLGVAVAAVLLAGSCALFAVATLLAWLVNSSAPQWRSGESGGAPNAIELVKTALLVVGAAGGAVALTVSYRKQRIAEREEVWQTKERRDNQAKEFRERYSSAATLLGSGNAAVQLAGVYALSNLADDWLEERQQCVDLLCSYVRLPSAASEASNDSSLDRVSSDRVVRSTIIRKIGEHLVNTRRDGEGPWSQLVLDLSGGWIPGIDWGGCYLHSLDLSGADVENACNLSDCTISGLLKFDSATIVGSLLMEMTIAREDVSLDGCHLGEVYMGHAEFHNHFFCRGSEVEKFVALGVLFDGPTYFTGTHFIGEAAFNASVFREGWFTNAEFRSSAEFHHTLFKSVLLLDGSRFESKVRLTELWAANFLHEGTVFAQGSDPSDLKDVGTAEWPFSEPIRVGRSGEGESRSSAKWTPAQVCDDH